MPPRRAAQALPSSYAGLGPSSESAVTRFVRENFNIVTSVGLFVGGILFIRTFPEALTQEL